MPSQAVLSACSVALAHGVYFPLERRYKAWKASRPELIMRRNWRGRLVPDLRVKRAEQAAIVALISVGVLGFLVLFTLAGLIR